MTNEQATDAPALSTIDRLMAMDPLSLAKDKTAIAELIVYYRKQRGKMAEGIKPQRRKTGAAAQVGPALDLVALGIAKPQVQGLKRRV